MFRVGEKVGDYEIVAKLRAGGMATLFLARRTGASGFTKHVAIKVVHDHLAADKQFVGMFVDEALLSARVQHPNVVHVEELKQSGKRHYLVMEFVDGCSLSQLVKMLARRERRPTPELAAFIAIKVADGLHAAHELRAPDGSLEGLVHRDISPQNILLAWKGHVKLIDFGVAKARSRAQQTTGASFKGKIRYMSPEQAKGRSIDRRTDVYALGIVLWELLTMKRRFTADNDFALLDMARDPERIAPSEHNPDVSPELDAVVMKALAVDPDERYATAQKFRRDLAKALPGALAVDASHLADLLAAVGEPKKSRKHLPTSLEVPLDLEDGDVEILQTMTISATGLGSFLESMSDVELDESSPDTTVTPPTHPTESGSVTTSGDGKRMLGLAGAALAVIAVGVGLGVLVSEPDAPPEPISTPLVGNAPEPAPAPAAMTHSPVQPQSMAEPAVPVAEMETVTLEPVELEEELEPVPLPELDDEPRMQTTMRTPMSMTMRPSMNMRGPVLADDFGF